MRRLLAPIALTAMALLIAGCATAAPATDGPATDAATTPAPASTEPAGPQLEGELTVYAAASLKLAFDELATVMEAKHPELEVAAVVYDGSSTLATQLIEGAPADVFASADEKNMQKVVDAGLIADPQLFATNTLVIVVPAGNPGNVETLADFAKPELSVVLCAPEVPCGAASTTLLANAAVAVTPASLEQNVTGVLTKVAAGEADAGLVYATDVVGNADVESIVPDGADDVVNRYPIAALTGAGNTDAAAEFVSLVLGDEGQEILARLGFGTP